MASVSVNFVLILFIIGGSICNDDSYDERHDNKVLLSLYMESLCPYCHEFITDQLVPAWINMSDYFDIDIIPYGNAKRHLQYREWVIECQHGPHECRLNMIQACAVKMFQQHNPALLLHYLYCMSSQQSIDEDIDQKCAQELHIPYRKLKRCANSNVGKSFMLKLAKRTESQRPILGWVPFVGFNGVLDRDEQDLATSDLPAALCNHISGTKPLICDKKRLLSWYDE